MRYEADGLMYTESEFQQIACLECVTEFGDVSTAEDHVRKNPGHAVVVSNVTEMEIVGT